MDSTRARRNQELLLEVRRGQGIVDDLRMCEVGLKAELRKSRFLMDTLSPQMRQLTSVDARTAVRGMVNAIACGVRIEGITNTMRQRAIADPSLNPIIPLMQSGYRVALHNILNLRDYSQEGAWQPFAAKIIAHIREERLQGFRALRMATKARRLLVEENTPLMQDVASRSCKRDRSRFDDMLSVAQTQFIICMDHTYNPEAEPRVLFTTYARSCMEKRCLGAMGTPQSITEIPHGRHVTAMRVLAGELPLDARDVVDPQEREEEAEVRRHLKAVSQPTSLEAPASADGDATVADLHLSMVDAELDRAIDEIAVSAILDKALRTSGLSHHLVANERLGIGGSEGDNTFEEIARILLREGLTEDEVTRQRIGQIWTEAKKQIGENVEHQGESLEIRTEGV